MTGKSIQELIDQCASGDEELIVHALFDLMDLKAGAAAPMAIEFLSSESSWVRGVAAYALSKLAQTDADKQAAGAALLPLLTDEESRNDAVETLGALAYAPARDAVAGILLNDPEWVVRASAAESLGSFGDARSLVELVIALKNDPEYPVRNYAADSLGLLGTAADLPLIAELLEEEGTYSVRINLLVSAYRLGDESAMDTILTMLAQANDDMDLIVAINVIDSLIFYRPPDALARDAARLIPAIEVAAIGYEWLNYQAGAMCHRLAEMQNAQG